jgi:hypothetical protein
MKEIRKQKKKKGKLSRPDRTNIRAAPCGEYYPPLAQAQPARARPRVPIFLYFSDFSEPISIQIRISQDLQYLFWIRLFLHVPNSKPWLSNRPTPLYIAPPPYIYVSLLEIPKSSPPKL